MTTTTLHFGEAAKLKTKKIVFEKVFAARDPVTLEQLKELSSKRKLVEESLNDSTSITTAVAREMSGGLTTRSQQVLHNLEQYIPLVDNLIFHLDRISSNISQILLWTSELKIQWTSALSSSSFLNFRGPKYFQINNLRFEYGMVLFLYGGVLRERALEVLPTDLVQSATHFREAAGVFHYLANVVLPCLLPALTTERPPEAVSSVSNVMRLICLAEAQAVTIKRAEEKGTSVGLLAKLHHGVAQLLDEAAGVLHTASGECRDISSRFVDFISSCKVLHELKSQKYLAESLKISNQFGVAVGVLQVALKDAKKKMPSNESWTPAVKEEIDKFAEILRKEERENDFVWHEMIPPKDNLPKPEGNRIASIIPYVPKRCETQLAFKI